MRNIGRYQMEEFLGEGGMGEVHRALDPTLGRSVAIKTIPLGRSREPGERERLLARLRREAESAGRLSHPGIVTIHDFLEEGELACIVMEYIAGRTLDKLIRPGRPLDKETCLGVLRQAAEALDHAHQHGVIHRDIKPANVILQEKDGLVKILDFGVAKVAYAQRLTETGYSLGTPGYMSPEHYGAGPVEAPADQFSLAVMAYELLTGVNPFAAETPAEVMHRVMREEPPPVGGFNPGLSGQVNGVLRRALAKNPRNRYPSCAQFVAALGTALASIPDREPATERTRQVQAPSAPPVAAPPSGLTRRSPQATPQAPPAPAPTVSPVPVEQPIEFPWEREARRKRRLRAWLLASAALIVLVVVGVLVYRVVARQPPAQLEVLTPPALPDATVGRPYAYLLAASGGVPPYKWRTSGDGRSPEGLTLVGDQGLVLGTPTAAGSYGFGLLVSDSRRKQEGYQVFTLHVGLAPPPLLITSTLVLPEGMVGERYALALGGSGGLPPYAWSISAGNLPSGLALDAARGVIHSTPAVSGDFQFRVRLAESLQATAAREFRLRVAPRLLITTSERLPEATVGGSYSCELGASGGTPPYRWRWDESHPPGLVLDEARGRIVGKPQRSGTHRFWVRLADGIGWLRFRRFELSVLPLRGEIEWRGELESNTPLIIEGRRASRGSLSGELPGTPVNVEVKPGGVVVVGPPGPTVGGWKSLILNSPNQRQTRIVIRWTDQR